MKRTRKFLPPFSEGAEGLPASHNALGHPELAEGSALEPAMLRQLMAQDDHPMWVTDMETLRFLEVNEAAIQRYGYTRDEFLAMTILDIRPQEEKERLQDYLTARRETNTATSGSWQHRTREGVLLHVDVVSYPMTFEGHSALVITVFDHTEQRRQQARSLALQSALRASHERFRAVVEGLNDGILITDLDDRILYANPRLAELTGYTITDLVRDVAYRLLMPLEEWPRRLRAQWEDASRQTETYETRMYNRSGASLWVLINASPLRDPDSGDVIGTVSAVTDMTQRRHAQDALRESETKFRTAFDDAAIGIAIIDATGTLQEVNAPLCRLLQYDRKELIGASLADFAVTDGSPLLNQQLIARALNGEVGPMTLEKRYRRRDGEEVSVELSASVVRNARGRPSYMVGHFLDLTARKKAEIALSQTLTALRAERDRRERVMRNARCLLWEADVKEQIGEAPMTPEAPIHTTWEITFAAENVAPDWLPFTILPGQTFTNAWEAAKHPEDRPRMDRIAALALTNEESGYSQEFRLLLPSGEMRWLREDVTIELVSSVASQNKAENERLPRQWRLVGVCTDVTERRQMNEHIIRTEKMVALGELVAGIAHEMNNPLAAISGQAQLLGMHPDGAVREDAAMIRSMADRAARILRSLLAFARQGGGENERRIYDIRTMLESVLDLVRVTVRHADIELTIEMPDQPAPVYANETQIEQVIVNLIQNAVHALTHQRVGLPAGAIFLRAQVVENVGTSGGAQVTLDVSDNGPGIPATTASRIFDPFFTTKQIGEGTGLGLSICHGILESHGGSIVLLPTVPRDQDGGGGATFRITLPLAD